jgi:hypothetical protein
VACVRPPLDVLQRLRPKCLALVLGRDGAQGTSLLQRVDMSQARPEPIWGRCGRGGVGGVRTTAAAPGAVSPSSAHVRGPPVCAYLVASERASERARERGGGVDHRSLSVSEASACYGRAPAGSRGGGTGFSRNGGF